MAPKDKVNSFQMGWLDTYGLKITAREPSSTTVASVKCVFCEKFGREQDEGSTKRRKIQTVKYFRKPWRSDNIAKHMREQHPQNFAEYRGLDSKGRREFLESQTGSSMFLTASAQRSELRMLIDKSIVETIIAGLLLHPEEDDINLNSRSEAIKIFQLQSENSGEADLNLERYMVSIPNLMQFDLVVKYLRAGLSFSQCCSVLLDTKETIGLGVLGSLSMSRVICYARFICAMALQTISGILDSVWAFSLALDGGTKSNASYLDVRIRFYHGGQLHNFHLIALPLYSRHTGENVYNLVVDFMDALYTNWKAKLVGLSSDGASNMTGVDAGVVSRLHRVVLPGCYRVWCCAHQIDLVVQKAFTAFCDDHFVDHTMAITGHLRRQQLLVKAMGSKCPRFISTRWLSMQKYLKWLVENRVRLCQYFAEKKPDCEPTNAYWITAYMLLDFTTIVNHTLVAIQGLSTMMNEQKKRLKRLIIYLKEVGDIEGPGQFDDEEGYLKCGQFRISYQSAEILLKDSDVFVVNCLDDLKANSPDQYCVAVHSAALLYARCVNGFQAIVVGHDARNEVMGNFPPVMPFELVRLRPHQFYEIVRMHTERLSASKTAEEIIEVNEQFKKMKTAYHMEEHTKAIVDEQDYRTTFEMGWRSLLDRFPKLCEFAGGLASVFPGTSTVESDFSVIGWGKDDYRTALTDFSLEGILHSKQHDELRKLLR